MLLRAARGPDGTQNSEVVGLGAAAEKDQFLGVAAEQGGGFATGSFQALPGVLTLLVDAGGVARYLK